MSTRKILGTMFLFTMFIFNGAMSANAKMFAVGPKIGTLGGGIEGRIHLGNNLFARAAVQGFNYKTTLDDININYDGEVELFHVPVMLDFHPFSGSGFRISGGLAYVKNEVKVTATQRSILAFLQGFDTNITTSAVTGTIENKNNLAPIISVGYDGSLVDSGFVTFDFEAGVMYNGDAKIRITTTDNFKDPVERAKLDESIRKATDDIRKRIKLYPVISLGVKLNF